MKNCFFYSYLFMICACLSSGCATSGERGINDNESKSEFEMLNATNNRGAIESYLTEQLSKDDVSPSVRELLNEKLTGLYIDNMDAESAKLSIKKVSDPGKKIKLQVGIDIVEGNYTEAIKSLNSINHQDRDASIYNLFAISNIGLKKFGDAENNLKTARDLDGNSAKSRNNLAFFYISQKEYSLAEKLLEDILMSNPTYYRAKFNLALCFFLQGNEEKASYILSERG